MTKPRLTAAITWPRYEKSVHAVFTEALRRVAEFECLPEAEEPLNLELYWVAIKVNHELRKSPDLILPFEIVFDSRSQPEPDDVAHAERLRKRPDFSCLLTNEQATDFRRSQLRYYLECKRLGSAQRGLVFNDLYSEEGVSRFIRGGHAYAKGCKSASMIGYLQSTDHDTVLNEVNAFAKNRSIPSLARAARAWAQREVTRLSQDPLPREFDPATIQLSHFWVDLRHCRVDLPLNQPPQAATPPKQTRTKQAAKTGSKSNAR
jgi:hypothetical protein